MTSGPAQRGGGAAAARRDRFAETSAPLPLRPPAKGALAPPDIARIREDFPILQRRIRGKPLVYLDNAATAQKPQAVIDAVSRFYSRDNANIHRGVHYLSAEATAAYDQVREQVAAFLHARSPREIVFTRGTTDSINLVAHSYARTFLAPGDEILITTMEHHSNIVPWQLACAGTGAMLRAAPLTPEGEVDLDAMLALLNDRTRLVALTHLSNAIGTINPIKRVIGWAHERQIPVLIDGAQSVAHLPVNVQDLDCDFFAFSGHKLFGPTGVGVLYGREALLERMLPYQGGGGMINTVTLEQSTWAALPAKFEAGTPMVAEVIGLGAAIDYVERIGADVIASRERELLTYASGLIEQIEGVRIIGTARDKASILSFVMDGVHPHDIGTILDDAGVAIRAGHHCAQPLMRHFGVPATARASFAFYNTKEEAEILAQSMIAVKRMFR
jgi:cysteine desulfurase / selenocysteine lyase